MQRGSEFFGPKRGVTSKEYLDAAIRGDLLTVKKYIQENINDSCALNVIDSSGNFALMLAVEAFSLPIVEELLRIPSINIEEQRGPYNALDRARNDRKKFGNEPKFANIIDSIILELQKAYAKKGVRLHYKFSLLEDGSREFTQFIDAVEIGNTEAVRKFIAENKNSDAINSVDANGRSALISAIKNGQKKVFDILCEVPQLDVNIKVYGDKALMEAVRSRSYNMVKFLLEKGADVNYRNYKTGLSVLMAATDDAPILTLLLGTPGIDFSCKDVSGKTALDYAISKNNPSIVSALNAAMGVKQRNSFQERLDKIHYEGKINSDFEDPCSLSIMNDPVALSSGIFMDRKSLVDYFAQNGNPRTLPCPTTQYPISIAECEFKTNVFMKNQIENFVKELEDKYAEKKLEENKPSPKV